MIFIEKTEVVGLQAAIRGMRNPMNSWGLSDSSDDSVGKNDLKLMKTLAKSGSDHAKFRRMIVVYADITAPLYWWKEYDTYKVGTVANSCSTMHKIHAKEFTADDFSWDHLISFNSNPELFDCVKTEIFYGDNEKLASKTITEDAVVLLGDGCVMLSPKGTLNVTIEVLNKCRELYLSTKDKKYWWQMIQLLPSSYNQKRTVEVNYEVLANIYAARRNHKLDEWHAFCDWIETLPNAEGIIYGL